MNKKNIVVIAGGNGSAKSCGALKRYASDYMLSAVVPMSDSGGANGRLSRELNVLPSADLLRAVLAFSPYEYKLLHKLFRENRFTGGHFEGHYLGNLFLMLTAKYAGDYMLAVQALEDAVEAVGRVYPATLTSSNLCVELSNGDTVIGEYEIDRPTYDRALRIKRAWLAPPPPLYDGARKAVLAADVILIGPGSLYTSIIAALAVEGMHDVIRDSRAKLIYVAGNARESAGETGPMRLSEMVRELEMYLPRPVDVVVYNNHVLSEKQIQIYEERGWKRLTLDVDEIKNRTVIGADFERENGGLDPEKLGGVLKKLIE